MFVNFHRPGQGMKHLIILSRNSALLEDGRPASQTYTPIGSIYGFLMRASHGDVEQWKSRNQWKQEGHPVTHKIIQMNGQLHAELSDWLQLSDNNSMRLFRIKGIHNPGELGYFTVYYVEERKDLSHERSQP